MTGITAVRLRGVPGPAFWITAGRTVGFVATFVVPLVLVRVFDQATFGTYKQLFLIYATVFGLAQMGVAESLYYFVPRRPGEAGRHAANAVLTLALLGTVAALSVTLGAPAVARWLSNPALADTLALLGVFLALMLTSAVFEIALVAGQRYAAAAWIYALSDIGRAAFLLVAAFALGGLRGVLWGSIAFAILRLALMLWTFWRAFPALRPDTALWQAQWAYTLPFALAVGVEVLQANLHNYVVAAHVDPATFAIYAVGCLQIPLVDVLTTSNANVMMVKMADEGFDRHGREAVALWHETVRRLALAIVPVVAFLVAMAPDLITVLFTDRYAASVPVFRLWTLTLVCAVPCVDAVLRASAQTTLLFGLNLLRLAIVLALITWSLSAFGLPGAALVMLLATAAARAIGLVRIAGLMGQSLATVLPWRALGTTVLCATLAAAPAVWFARLSSLPRVAVLAAAFAIYATTYAALWLRVGDDITGGDEPVRDRPLPVGRGLRPAD